MVLLNLQDSLAAAQIIDVNTLNNNKCVAKINPHFSWQQRACVIAFYLHPFFGNKDYFKVQTIYHVPQATLQPWLYRPSYISKWLPFVRNMGMKDILCSVPKPFRDHLVKQLSVTEGTASYPNISQMKLQAFKNKVKYAQQYVVFSKNEMSQKLLAVEKKKGTPYITQKQKSFAVGRPVKYAPVTSFVLELVQLRWESPKSSIAQKVPDNWKELALVGAERVRTLFLKEKVEVVLAADETFLKFHEKDDNLLVPRGVKRVGTASKIDEKDGCTLMVTMDMASSQLTTPFIIFRGTFGARLMKEWSGYKTSTVLFTENHWQTSSTVIIYLELLRKLYPTKRVIGLIWDKASSHYSEEVVDYITQSNETSTPKIIVDFVDAGLTSVYQPPDVMINKPLKKSICLQYKRLMADRLKNDPLVAGNQVSVSREELVGIVEATYYSINMQNNTGERYIQNSFDTCGLNPWSSDMHPFHNHLSSLSENGIYHSLLTKNFNRNIGERNSISYIQ